MCVHVAFKTRLQLLCLQIHFVPSPSIRLHKFRLAIPDRKNQEFNRLKAKSIFILINFRPKLQPFSTSFLRNVDRVPSFEQFVGVGSYNSDSDRSAFETHSRRKNEELETIVQSTCIVSKISSNPLAKIESLAREKSKLSSARE